MNATPRLGLPFLSPGQAQKEAFHNEALQALDMVVAASVEERSLTTPPETPVVGRCHIVGESAGGEWAGKDGSLACYSAAGWRFVQPVAGLTVHIAATGEGATFRDGGWEVGMLRGSSLVIDGVPVVGPQAGAIDLPGGGATIDLEARSAIAQVIGSLRHHGLIAT